MASFNLCETKDFHVNNTNPCIVNTYISKLSRYFFSNHNYENKVKKGIFDDDDDDNGYDDDKDDSFIKE